MGIRAGDFLVEDVVPVIPHLRNIQIRMGKIHSGTGYSVTTDRRSRAVLAVKSCDTPAGSWSEGISLPRTLLLNQFISVDGYSSFMHQNRCQYTPPAEDTTTKGSGSNSRLLQYPPLGEIRPAHSGLALQGLIMLFNQSSRTPPHRWTLTPISP